MWPLQYSRNVVWVFYMAVLDRLTDTDRCSRLMFLCYYKLYVIYLQLIFKQQRKTASTDNSKQQKEQATTAQSVKMRSNNIVISENSNSSQPASEPASRQPQGGAADSEAQALHAALQPRQALHNCSQLLQPWRCRLSPRALGAGWVIVVPLLVPPYVGLRNVGHLCSRTYSVSDCLLVTSLRLLMFGVFIKYETATKNVLKIRIQRFKTRNETSWQGHDNWTWTKGTIGLTDVA